MIKRIISIFAVVIITVVLLIPIVNAEEYIVNPEYNLEPLYEILPSVDQGGGAEPYIVYGIDVTSVTVIPDPVGFITHFFGSGRIAGEYFVNMYSTRNTELRSRLRLYISNNETMVLWYEVGDFLSGSSSDYYQYQITPSISINDDFMIYSARNGTLYQYYYDITNYIPSEPEEPLNFCFIGDIYIYGRTPGDVDNAIIQDAFDRGVIQGKQIGYQEGKADQQEIYNQSIDAIKQAEFDAGYAVGKEDGIQEASMSDDQKTYWYNAGYTAGQNTNGLVEEGITGFWNAMQGFVEPFLNIGIGSLRVSTILALLLIGGLAFIIIRLTRG